MSRELVRNLRKASEQCYLQIGDKVKMVNCLEAECHADEVWTVASAPWEVCGSVVIKLDGYRGGFDVTKLQRI